MSQAQTIDELLGQMVSGGRMTRDEARSIAAAPRFRLEVREMVSYLAAVIIGVGVIRLVAAIVEDADVMAIAGGLYVLAALLGLLTRWLRAGTTIRKRFGEVTEIGATFAAAVATGLMVSEAGWSDEASVLLPAALALAWGIFRCRGTEFSGTATIIPSLFATVISFGNLVEMRDEAILLMSIGAALLLIGGGLLAVNAAALLRVAGAVAMIFTLPGWVGQHSDDGWAAVGLAIGVGVFSLGATKLRPELLLSSGIVITASVAIIVFENIDNEIAQGLIVVAVGLLMLGATSMVMRRGRVRKRSLGAASA